MLKTMEIETEEMIKLLHSRICQCITYTLNQQLTTLGSEFLGTVSEIVGLYCISYTCLHLLGY